MWYSLFQILIAMHCDVSYHSLNRVCLLSRLHYDSRISEVMDFSITSSIFVTSLKIRLGNDHNTTETFLQPLLSWNVWRFFYAQTIDYKGFQIRVSFNRNVVSCIRILHNFHFYIVIFFVWNIVILASLCLKLTYFYHISSKCFYFDLCLCLVSPYSFGLLKILWRILVFVSNNIYDKIGIRRYNIA